MLYAAIVFSTEKRAPLFIDAYRARGVCTPAMNRFKPYPNAVPASMHVWFGSSSEVHPLKADQTNADAFFVGSRFMGVFDGVGGVANEGLQPNAMSVDLANRVSAEMEVRLGDNAQQYDRDTQFYLKSSVRPNVPGGWLRNLVARSFANTEVLGSTVLGVCHQTNDKLDYCVLGDIKLFLFRRNSHNSVCLMESVSGGRRVCTQYPQGI